MRSVEMKNRCLLYYGNPVGYRTEQGVVADSMFRREELEDWLARKGLAVRWEDGIYDRLSSGGYQKAADNGPALKSCRIWQLGPSAPAAMRFIGLDRMSGEYGGPDLTRYQAVFDGTVSTNSLDGIWEFPKVKDTIPKSTLTLLPEHAVVRLLGIECQFLVTS